jgi:hypothetical protein
VKCVSILLISNRQIVIAGRVEYQRSENKSFSQIGMAREEYRKTSSGPLPNSYLWIPGNQADIGPMHPTTEAARVSEFGIILLLERSHHHRTPV